MKLRCPKPSGERGSVLMVSLFIACILGIALGSCLVMVRFEHDSAVRSQAWNAALTMAEGGIEEAMAKLNSGANSGVRAAPQAPEPFGPISRSLSGGSNVFSFGTVNGSPTISATGYVAVPSISATLTRVVQVTVTNAPLFTTALATTGMIDLDGSSFSTDSYDSADPNLSNPGHYPGYRSPQTSTNGDVATVGGLVDAGSTHIHGDLFLGPNASGSATNYGLVSGTVHNDLNVDFPGVVIPTTVSWLPAYPQTYSTNDITYSNAFFLGGSYTVSGLSGSVYVGPNANVTLLISGNARLGDIRVASDGFSSGSLTIYMAAASFTVGGDTTVDNGNATNLTYFGLPGNTSITLQGTTNFIGTLYAPAADLNIDTWSWEYEFDFIGSCVTKSVSVSGYGRCRFHYDENLGRSAAPRRGHLAVSWQELH